MTIREAVKAWRISDRVIYDLCRRRMVKCKKTKQGWKILEDYTKPTFTTRAIAKSLNVSEQLVRRFCQNGRVKARKFGRQWRIQFDEALKLIHARLGGMVE